MSPFLKSAVFLQFLLKYLNINALFAKWVDSYNCKKKLIQCCLMGESVSFAVFLTRASPYELLDLCTLPNSQLD